VPRLFREKYLEVDVAVIHVTRPNAFGYCSYGVSCDYTKAAAESAGMIIAEANDQMPFIGGDNFIHLSKIDHIVETSNPIFELPTPKIGDVEKAIGENCATLIEDGSTLQLGIGAIPDAVAQVPRREKGSRDPQRNVQRRVDRPHRARRRERVEEVDSQGLAGGHIPHG